MAETSHRTRRPAVVHHHLACIEVADDATWRELEAVVDLRRDIVRRLSETVVLIKRDRAHNLIQTLQSLGYHVRVVGG